MSLYERVCHLIVERGITIKQLERDCGLANATIRRWETQIPNIESVKKVAQTLQVSLDFLVCGTVKEDVPEILISDNLELQSSPEAEIIKKFLSLNTRNRENICDYIGYLSEKEAKEKDPIHITDVTLNKDTTNKIKKQ